METTDKFKALNKAIEITKEFARGGSGKPPEEALDKLYRKIIELQKDANTEK